jgi:hypothetical protein
MMQRTTFSMSPRVARSVYEKSKAEKKSVSAVINELLENALDGTQPPKKLPFKVRPFDLGVKESDPQKLKKLIYEMDLEDNLDRS